MVRVTSLTRISPPLRLGRDAGGGVDSLSEEVAVLFDHLACVHTDANPHCSFACHRGPRGEISLYDLRTGKGTPR